MKLKQIVFDYYVLIALVALAVAFTFIPGARTNAQAIALLVGTAVSFVFLVQKQKLQEVELFRTLFIEFTERYDDRNEKLQDVLDGDQNKPLTRAEKNTLSDYFNLCAEEYLFYKQGYIHPKVWRAWRNGMQIYFANRRIKDFWHDEQKTESYYDFSPFEAP